MPQVSFSALVAGISSGHCLSSFPTDTVPALASRPDRAELIFAAKQRSQDKPLILMADSLADLWPYVLGSEAERQAWQQIADRHWPGALTLVLPASDRVHQAMHPQDPTTIGVRVPNHPLAQKILSHTGPLATTSANLSGQPPLLTMAEIEAQFPQVLTLIATESGNLGENGIASGVPSTVVKWTTQGWQVLRQGAVKLDSQAL